VPSFVSDQDRREHRGRLRAKDWVRVSGSRFLQTDPVPGGSANDYDYAAQDPINAFDLDGRMYVVPDGGFDWHGLLTTLHEFAKHSGKVLSYLWKMRHVIRAHLAHYGSAARAKLRLLRAHIARAAELARSATSRLASAASRGARKAARAAARGAMRAIGGAASALSRFGSALGGLVDPLPPMFGPIMVPCWALPRGCGVQMA
jgi:hypothetical protein